MLFSVHGIRTKGEWQKGAAAVLAPFCRYHAIKYPEFRSRLLAPLKLGAELCVILAAFAAAILVMVLHLQMSIGWWVAFVATSSTATLLARSYAASQREKALTHIYEEISAVGYDRPPYVIAHSLGSFLTCVALEKYTDLCFDTVILHGCVLSRNFPWRRMSTRFVNVTNEVALSDWVPFAAAVLGSRVHRMGCAGSAGFRNRGMEVHAKSAGQDYPNCHNGRCWCTAHKHLPACSARIHNIRHRFLGHDSFHHGANHARIYWLALLWGYDPMMLRRFRDTCLECDETEDLNLDPDKHMRAVDRLRHTCWGWSKGPLERFIEKQLEAKLEERAFTTEQRADLIPDLTNVTLRTLWCNVTQACKEAAKSSEWDRELLEHMQPVIAVRRAVAAVVAECGEYSEGTAV